MKTGSFQTTGTLPRIMEIDGNLGKAIFFDAQNLLNSMVHLEYG
jgi:hypothetical protein